MNYNKKMGIQAIVKEMIYNNGAKEGFVLNKNHEKNKKSIYTCGDCSSYNTDGRIPEY